MDIKQLVPSKLKEKFNEIDFQVSEYFDELTIKVPKEHIVKVCEYLKNDSDLEFLLCQDITAVDWVKRKNRFTVVYHIYSFKNNFRLRLKADVDDSNSAADKSDCSIDSVTSVWKGADWQERETYDMYGIKFNNHPDFRRMYMPEDFEHFPLRKDFPLMGIPGSIPLPKK